MTFLALVLAIVIIITLDEPERAGCHTSTSTCVSPIAASVASASSPTQAVSLSGVAAIRFQDPAQTHSHVPPIYFRPNRLARCLQLNEQ